MDTAYLPPAFADLGKQLRTRLADLFGRGVRILEFVEELLDTRIVGHDATSPPALVGSGSARSFLARVQVADRGSKPLQSPAPTPVNRHYRNPEHPGHLA